MFDFAFIDPLPPEEKRWLAQAIVGMAVADDSLVKPEMIYIQSILKCIESKDDADELVTMLKQKKKPKLHLLKTERERASRMFVILAEVAVIDNRFTQQEAEYLQHIGERLGFDAESIHRVMNWASDVTACLKKSSPLIHKLKDTTPFFKNI